MPDHIHIIIQIKNRVGDATVGAGRDRPLPDGYQRAHKKTKPIPELLGAFKTTSSKLIHRSGLNDFQWQRSFWDTIIRNEYKLQEKRIYIKNNPAKWPRDHNHVFSPNTK